MDPLTRVENRTSGRSPWIALFVAAGCFLATLWPIPAVEALAGRAGDSTHPRKLASRPRGLYRKPDGKLALTQLSSPSTAQTDDPPNIVLILTDDQRWDTLCGLPNSLPEACAGPVSDHPMPVVEQELIANGVVFTNAFSSNPLCCPFRASLLSGGFYSHHTNVLTNLLPNGGVLRFADGVTLPTLLQQQGYRTAIVGKYMNIYLDLLDAYGYPYLPPGWDRAHIRVVDPDWRKNFTFSVGSTAGTQSGAGSLVTLTDGTYLTDYERDRALEFIDETCEEQHCRQPFFLFLSASAPHEPATPATRHAGLFSDFLYRGRGWNEQPDGDLRDKPQIVRNLSANYKPADADLFQANQLRSLRAVDEAIGAVLDELEAKGLMQNTVIIFASDQGYLWGEHRMTGKKLPYEESIRVPLVIRHPAIAARREGRLVAAEVDFAATILDLAGVPPIGGDGLSLMPLLRDPGTPWRDELLIQAFKNLATNDDVPSWAAVRTEDNWMYVEYITGERELYNLDEDPYQLISRHNDPAYATRKNALALRLQQLKRGIAIRTDNLPEPTLLQLPTGVAGQPYSFQMTAWGGNGSYLWSVHVEAPDCTGGLPTGLSISASGLVSGTPDAPGEVSVCLKVEDSSNSPQPGNERPQYDILPFQWVIAEPTATPPPMLTWTATPTPTATEAAPPSPSPTRTETPSDTLTPSATPTALESPTASDTPTASSTPSVTLTPSSTPTETATPPGPGLYDDLTAYFAYTGAWSIVDEASAYKQQFHLSSQTGDAALFSYRGWEVSYVYCAGPDRGIAELVLDGITQIFVDEHATSLSCGKFHMLRNVAFGTHTLEVRTTGLKNPASSGIGISVDAAVALTEPTATHTLTSTSSPTWTPSPTASPTRTSTPTRTPTSTPIGFASYSSGDLNLNIPDNNPAAPLEITITVPGSGFVTDVNLGLRLNHTWDGDLDIVLLAPDGSAVELSTDNGASGDNFGSGAADCTGAFTAFDDSAAASIALGAPPFAGPFRPEGSLTAFSGTTAAGAWRLRITDDASLDVGTLFCWQLDLIVSQEPPAPTATRLPTGTPTNTPTTTLVWTPSRTPSPSHTYTPSLSLTPTISPTPSRTRPPTRTPVGFMSYSSGNLTLPIADNSVLDSTIAVASGVYVADANVRLRLDHTFDADLDIFLIAPDSTVVELSTDNGTNGDNFGTGPGDCTGTLTSFDDASGTSILIAEAPYAGSFRPESPLSTLEGRSAPGNWTLRIADDAAVDTGTLFCWELELTTSLTQPAATRTSTPTSTPSQAPTASSTPVGYSIYTSPALDLPIPDFGTLEAMISISAPGAAEDVKVGLRIDHGWDADLDIVLVAPDGRTVELSSDNGGGDDNYGSGPADCGGTFTTFDDGAATPITAAAAPFGGQFRPESPLSALAGASLAGDWTLRISDDSAGIAGALFCWQLEVAPAAAPSETPTETHTSTSTSSLSPSSTLTGTPLGTAALTPTASSTRKATRTPSATPTRTRKPSRTPTGTLTNTRKPTKTVTATPTKTRRPTKTPTSTPTATRTPRKTKTPTLPLGFALPRAGAAQSPPKRWR